MNDRSVRAGIAKLLATTVSASSPKPVTGGCIHECFRFETEIGPVFVKVAPLESLDMLEAEAAGLAELKFAASIRVPESLAVGAHEETALLVLEWIDLKGGSSEASAALGERLASQHRMTQPAFGWQRDNYIGSTPQRNDHSTDWVNFWRAHRLGAQLNLAAATADAQFMERATLLSALMDGFFTSYVPDPALLHGDLWSGNCATDADGNPVIFDPAVYYGDRECDLAMTRLFGAFDNEFYAAYRSAYELDAGFEARTDLYNLYHVLNHHNLFGGVYLARAAAMVEKLLSELGH